MSSCRATNANAFDFDNAPVFDDHAERLESVLARYDAQPKPRWLKPEEVTEDGRYWVWEPADPGDTPPLFDRHPARFAGHTTIKSGTAFKCHPFVTTQLSDSCLSGYLFYGPLPEPPPPEVSND